MIIHWRLALVSVALILLPSIALSAFVLRGAQAHELTTLQGQLTAQARLVADAAAPVMLSNLSALDPLAKRLGAGTTTRVTIIGTDGVVLGDSQNSPAHGEAVATRPEVIAALDRGGNQSQMVAMDDTSMAVAAPIFVDGVRVGVARVAFPLDEVTRSFTAMRNAIAIASFLIAVATALLVLLLVEREARPIRLLTVMADNLANGRLDYRVRIGGKGEVARLGAAFNRMAADLETSIASIAAGHSKLQALLDTLTDAIIMVDRQRRIVLMNPGSERLLHLGPSAMGRTLLEALRDHRFDELLTDALEAGAWRELIFDRSQARQSWRAIAAPVSTGTDPLSLLVVQDMTELRRLEHARRYFIANISHELRTPLASIKALVETLTDGAIDDQQAARHFLNQVDDEVDHLTQMVRELVELARIESGEVPLAKESVAVEELVRPAIERLATQADRAGVTLQSHCLNDVPDVFVDPARIGQVLLNLLHNAIKFTPPGGVVTVHCALEGDSVAVSVTDTGQGIAPEDLPRIMERFYKADKARSRGGTGLGLSIAKHIVEAHGGQLRVKSVPAQGSTFTFTLGVAERQGAVIAS